MRPVSWRSMGTDRSSSCPSGRVCLMRRNAVSGQERKPYSKVHDMATTSQLKQTQQDESAERMARCNELNARADLWRCLTGILNGFKPLFGLIADEAAKDLKQRK